MKKLNLATIIAIAATAAVLTFSLGVSAGEAANQSKLPVARPFVCPAGYSLEYCRTNQLGLQLQNVTHTLDDMTIQLGPQQ